MYGQIATALKPERSPRPGGPLYYRIHEEWEALWLPDGQVFTHYVARTLDGRRLVDSCYRSLCATLVEEAFEGAIEVPQVAPATARGSEMATIPLTHGKVALVDDDDAKALSAFNWRAKKDGYQWYAERQYRDENGRQRHVLMHRQLLGGRFPEQVDHRNGDGLDNRRANLRLATPSQNKANCRKPSTNTSGYKGVTFHKQLAMWQAQIRCGGKYEYLGVFRTAEEAARAYDMRAQQYHGDFALTNFGSAA